MPGYLLIYSEVHINRLLVWHEGKGPLVKKSDRARFARKIQN